MSKKINSLILSIKETLEEFSGGYISFEEAKGRYDDLSKKYSKIEKELIKGEGSNLLSAVCYYNNIENCCLLSAVYNIEPDSASSLFYYGDNNINIKTREILRDNAGRINENEIIAVMPDGDRILHKVYVYPISVDKDIKTVFAAVSSSSYFSRKRFSATGAFFKDILSITAYDPGTLKLDYFDEISQKIKNLINEQIDDEYYITAHIYMFNSVQNIFSHLGFNSLLDVSEEIRKKIQTHFKDNTNTFILSVSDYIVLVKTHRDSMQGKRKRIEFICNDINLPYKTASIKIDKNESIYKLWENFFSLKNKLYSEN